MQWRKQYNREHFRKSKQNQALAGPIQTSQCFNIGAGIFDTISVGPQLRLCGFTALSQKRSYV